MVSSTSVPFKRKMKMKIWKNWKSNIRYVTRWLADNVPDQSRNDLKIG